MSKITGADLYVYRNTLGKTGYGGGGGKKRRPGCRREMIWVILIVVFVGAAVLIAYLNVR